MLKSTLFAFADKHGNINCMLEHHSDNPQKEALFQKLEKLPVQFIPEVDLFLDFLRLRYNGEKKLVEDYMRLAAEVWDDD